jgi:hypothetical protein
MLISKSLLISSANLATRELDEPPKTISSTYGLNHVPDPKACQSIFLKLTKDENS